MIFVLHHPLSAAGTLYLGLVAIILQLDAGVILVALVPLISVYLTYYLSNRTRRAIRLENARDAEQARLAAADLVARQEKTQEKVEEVHVLVNSQAELMKESLRVAKEESTRELSERDARIKLLEQRIALSPGVDPPA